MRGWDRRSVFVACLPLTSCRPQKAMACPTLRSVHRHRPRSGAGRRAWFEIGVIQVLRILGLQGAREVSRQVIAPAQIEVAYAEPVHIARIKRRDVMLEYRLTQAGCGPAQVEVAADGLRDS